MARRDIRVDGSKVRAELSRWLKGEIDEISEGYLSELVEVEGPVDAGTITVNVPFECPFCDESTTPVPCPECAILETEDCNMCGGIGGWLECRNDSCPGPDPDYDNQSFY